MSPQDTSYMRRPAGRASCCRGTGGGISDAATRHRRDKAHQERTAVVVHVLASGSKSIQSLQVLVTSGGRAQLSTCRASPTRRTIGSSVGRAWVGTETVEEVLCVAVGRERGGQRSLRRDRLLSRTRESRTRRSRPLPCKSRRRGPNRGGSCSLCGGGGGGGSQSVRKGATAELDGDSR